MSRETTITIKKEKKTSKEKERTNNNNNNKKAGMFVLKAHLFHKESIFLAQLRQYTNHTRR